MIVIINIKKGNTKEVKWIFSNLYPKQKNYQLHKELNHNDSSALPVTSRKLYMSANACHIYIAANITELWIRQDTKDNSKIIFLISMKTNVVTPD